MLKIDNTDNVQKQVCVLELPKYKDKIQQLLHASIAPETRRKYTSQLRFFSAWCESEHISPVLPLSPDIIAAYIAHLATKSAACSTVNQFLATIAAIHRSKNLTSPTESLLVKKTFKGYKRTHGIAPKKKDPATLDIIRLLLKALPLTSPKNIRNATIISCGFFSACRRSELSALDINDIKWTMQDDSEIALVSVRKSKTDQEGHGMTKVLFPCQDTNISPTHLLKKWLSLISPKDVYMHIPKKHQISEAILVPHPVLTSPLFCRILKNGRITNQRLTPQSIRLIILQATQEAGLSLNLSAHSLRSGFVTSAIRLGRSERSILNQTGHRSVATMREYFQREDALEDNASKDMA